jgi:hypothetical protein
MQIIEDLGPFYRDLISLGDALHGDKEDIPLSLFDSLSQDELVAFKESTNVHFFNQELSTIVNEYMERLHDIRRLLIKAHLQKRELAIRLHI